MDVNNHWKSKALLAVSFPLLADYLSAGAPKQGEKTGLGSPMYPAVQRTM